MAAESERGPFSHTDVILAQYHKRGRRSFERLRPENDVLGERDLMGLETAARGYRAAIDYPWSSTIDQCGGTPVAPPCNAPVSAQPASLRSYASGLRNPDLVDGDEILWKR
jgi:hypothetical protein